MNLRQIEFFCAVVRCSTTVGAAQELLVSQPAVSSTIKHLESQLGLALFDRIGKRLVPTAEAMSLYEDAQQLIVGSEAIKQKAASLRDAKVGHLRVLSTHQLGYSVVPQTIQRFLHRRRNVQLSFEVHRMEDVLDGVENCIADVGIAMNPNARATLKAVPFVEGQLLCAFAQDHPLSEKKVISINDLRDVPVIGLQSPLGILLAKVFKEAGITYRPFVEVRHCVTACALAESGVGVAMVDEFSAARASAHLAVRAFEPTIVVKGYAVFLKNRPLSTLATRFISELKSQARVSEIHCAKAL